MSDQQGPVVSEAVAVFHDVSHLDAAVEELRAAGFGKDDISLLAQHPQRSSPPLRAGRGAGGRPGGAAGRLPYPRVARRQRGPADRLAHLPAHRGRGRHRGRLGRRGRRSRDRHRDRRGADRHGACPLAGQEPRRAPAGAAGPRRSAALGAHARRQPRSAAPSTFSAALRARRAHSPAAGRRAKRDRKTPAARAAAQLVRTPIATRKARPAISRSSRFVLIRGADRPA